MYKYAEIYAGKVRDIKESHLAYAEFCSIWTPTAFWLDVTGVEEIGIGWILKANVEVGTYFEAPELPEETLETKKAAKLEELGVMFAKAEAEAYLTSSLGFVINAGEKANRDIDGLVKLMEAMPDMQTVDFCCYDNSFKSVTLADLKTLQVEVILSGNALYAQKWAFRNTINAATTKEELDALQIGFTFADFSPPEQEQPEEAAKSV